MTRRIQIATTSDEIMRCFEVMRELRPHLVATEFAGRVTRQQAQGYRLAFLECDGVVRSVAGYRLMENLFAGQVMYVDDLVTRAVDHGGGFGSALFDWLVMEAKKASCEQFHLDSGVQRFAAHRFYLHKGMDIVYHHFAMKL